ncbi:MAG: leucine--tRNA ligase [Anaerolineae bacterium]|jgi:leucyl-tRNA synthetase
MAKRYDPGEVEPRWQRVWEESGLYRTDLDHAKNPFYNLMEFPYPSGEGLHVGHVYSFGGADAYGRYRRMRGHDLFQPMGFDAFGIHAENYALKQGVHPADLVPRNVRRFREEQLKRMGAAFDWSREINTTDPEYYRWTQWIFLQLYRGGLAYRAKAPVNWCPSCLTTLADEQVIGGLCERCDTPVEQRELTQWFLRITRYTERLLDFSGAEFSETTQRLQSHWIGRRRGAEIDFADADGGPERITVFSTRPDTLYGASFVALAPEHPDLSLWTTPERRSAVERYVQQARRRSDAERMAGSRDKTGEFTERYVINPVNGRRLPVWVADYVLPGFGSGAIFGTPAHDGRDLDFARAHHLPIRPVVRPPDDTPTPPDSESAYEGDGTLIHSGPYDGMTVDEAQRAIVADLAARGVARPTMVYRLRDWLISRQRYWGPPIPIIYCSRCGEVPVPEEDLPVRLPYSEQFRPLGTGESPLEAVDEFVHTHCPQCGGPARRETDVSDNFLDSAWYYLRYTSTERHDRPWDNERLMRWLPVHMYIGGIEHSTMHHLYARFIWKALQDLGHIPAELGPEPFRRLHLHGLIIKDGQRMSKSRGNVVVPDEYIDRYGADVLRVYLLFMGPFEEGGDFRDDGIHGIVRFFGRAWRLATAPTKAPQEPRDATPLQRAMHRTIRKVTEDMEGLAFNTAIAALMGYLNTLQEWQHHAPEEVWDRALDSFILMLAPLAPHLAEEIWTHRGNPPSVHRQSWPTWDDALTEEETITLPVQVDGRLRHRMAVPADLPEEEARRLALAAEPVQRHIEGRAVRRTVYVPGRLINLVLERNDEG